MKVEIKIITLGDIFKNIETEEKAFRFKNYIRDLQQENERLNNIINELEEYIKPYLYMLNGIQDRDIYEQCQLDDFTDIMEKLQELKEE